MQWHDEGIILGSKHHGETSLIVELMTRSHGRHLGIVKGGRSRRYAALMQAGNCVSAEWWARLDEHLGSYKLEAITFSAAQLIATPMALYALQVAACHLRLLPERDPHPALFDLLTILIEHSDSTQRLAEILVRFELRLLEELGFGLDLGSCAATGGRDNLVYVSPKSARAVSKEAGEIWKDKLLPLPDFLKNMTCRAETFDDLLQGFQTTGYFLTRHVWEARAIEPPPSRTAILRLLSNR